MVAPSDAAERIVKVRQSMDTCASSLAQGLLRLMLEHDLLESHVASLRSRYPVRRDRMIAALAHALPPESGVRWRVPDGGMFIWLQLPVGYSGDDLARAALDEQVVVVPGSAFSTTGDVPAVRLCFSSVADAVIEPAVRRIARAFNTLSPTGDTVTAHRCPFVRNPVMTASADATTDRRYVPRAYVALHPITAATAEGSRLIDVDGRSYLDLAGGIGVVNVGHRAPSVVAAIHQQVDRLLHSGPVTSNALYGELARRLTERAGPGRDLQALFVSSGAEAVENAVKLARHATGRPALIAFERSFHGRTLLTATLTGRSGPHKSQPGAMAPDVHHASYPYPLRPPAGVAPGRLVDHAIASLDSLLETRVPRDKVAAVIVEPVQGEGGFVIPPAGFLRRVEAWCRSNDVLLIVDEIQTGFGRTGRFFAFEHEGVQPDIITVGKSIADGLPLAGVLAPCRALGPRDAR